MSLTEKIDAKLQYLEDEYGTNSVVVQIQNSKARGAQLDVPSLLLQISVVVEMLNTTKDALHDAGIQSNKMEKRHVATFLSRGSTWINQCVEAFELQSKFEAGAPYDNKKMRKLMCDGDEDYAFGVSSWIDYMKDFISTADQAKAVKAIAGPSTGMKAIAAGEKRKRV